MTGAMDVVARLRAENEDFNSAMDESSESVFKLDKAGLAVGATLVGLGTGLKGVTDQARDMDLQYDRLAAASGNTRGELVGLSKELSNVTFSQQDVADGMDVLIKRGITTRDEMKTLLPLADRYADAWGVDMAQATATVIDTMKVFGGSAKDTESHLDTVAFLTQRTSGDFNRLERQIRTNRAEFDELGVGLEDSVAVIRALEASGKDGDTAMRLFGDAIQDSKGDTDAFWASLNLGEDAIAEARREMAEFDGATQRAADSYAESKTLWDKLVFSFEEGTLGMGRMLAPMRDMAPVMQSAGSAALIMSTVNFKALVPSLVATATAGWAAILPWLPLIIAIGAVIAVGVLLWRNWDMVSQKAIQAWGAVKEFTLEAVGFLTDLFFKWHPAGILISKWDEIKALFSGAWDTFHGFGRSIIVGLAVGITKFALAPVEAIQNAARGVIDKVKGFFGINSPSTVLRDIGKNLLLGLAGGIKDAASLPLKILGGVTGKILGHVGDLAGKMRDAGRDTVSGFRQGLKAFKEDPEGTVKKGAKAVIGRTKKWLGIRSPSRISERIGEDWTEGFRRGNHLEDAIQDPLRGLNTSQLGSDSQRSLQGVVSSLERLLMRLGEQGDAMVVLDGREVGRILNDVQGRRIKRWEVQD